MGIVIGVTGTNGGGKGTIVEYLVKQRGFKHFTFRGYFTQKLQERGTEVNRDTMRDIANELRQTLGEKYFQEVLGDVYASGDNYVVESIRTPSEVDFLKKQPDTYLFSADADQKIRYERIVPRGSETDNVTFDEFCDQEFKEMQNTDPSKQNLSYCMEHTDPKFKFINNGTVEEFHVKIDEAMKYILPRKVAIITYPGGKPGWELVKRIKALGIDHFPISLGSHDEPELSTLHDGDYVGFDAITKYLDAYQVQKLKTTIPKTP